MAGKFTKDTLITLISKILLLALGIGTSIIIARVLGPEGKGIYSLAILLSMLLITFTSLGIGPASIYFIGKKKYHPKEILGVNIIFSILISVLAIIVGLIIIFFFSNKLFPGIEKEYLILALLLIPFYIFLTFVIDVLLGLRKIKKYNLILIIQALCSLLLVIIFLLGLRLGIKAAIFTEILSFAIACIVLFLQAEKETGGIILRFNKNLLTDFISYGSEIYFGNVATFLYLKIDLWMINFFLNPMAAGFYSVSAGLAEKIWLISQSAGIVLFPKVSSEKEEKKLKEFTPFVCRNILFISFLIAAVLFLVGGWLIILLYSKAFSESILSFQVLLIGCIAVSGARIITSDFAGRGKPIINTYIAIASLVVNLVMDLILIPKLGIIGAAWASSTSYVFMFALKVIIYSKVSRNRVRDIIFIKKSDFRFYKNFLLIFKNKYFNSRNSL